MQQSYAGQDIIGTGVVYTGSWGEMVDLTERKVVQPTFLIHESTSTKYASLFLLDYYLLQFKHLIRNTSSPHSPRFQSIHFGKTLASLRHHPY